MIITPPFYKSDSFQSRYFTVDELECKCGCKGLPKYELVYKLDYLREACGFPLIVTSGYRCPAHNKKTSKSGEKGPHTTGFAVDIAIENEKAAILVEKAFKYGFKRIGVSQRDGVKGFIHLDLLTKEEGFICPNIWSY